jgi:hypothetical protein
MQKPLPAAAGATFQPSDKQNLSKKQIGLGDFYLKNTPFGG